MIKDISKIDKHTVVYKGTIVDKTLFENYLFSYGDRITIADAWVNARGPREAINKLLDKLNLPQYNYNRKEDFIADCDWGYIEVEEVNYYDKEDDCIYKYYCKVTYK